MSTPAVSIGIAAYRRPVELQEAMASVLSQSFTDLELIVGDETGELEGVVREFDDPRVRYVSNRRRLGITGNYNALLDSAQGRFIGLLNDDDKLLPGYLTSVVSALEDDASIGVAFTNHFYFRSDSGRLVERSCALPAGKHAEFLYPLMVYAPVANSASLMRREVWEQVRPMPDLHTSDRFVQIRAALAGWAFYYIDHPLAAYRVHPGQASSDERRFRDDNVTLWESFRFDDSGAERLRCEYLARSLASRTAAHVKRGEWAAARADAERARSTAPGRLGLRDRVVVEVAQHRALARVAAGTWRLTRRSGS